MEFGILSKNEVFYYYYYYYVEKPLLWTVDRMNLGSTSFQTRIFGSQTCLSNGVCVY